MYVQLNKPTGKFVISGRLELRIVGVGGEGEVEAIVYGDRSRWVTWKAMRIVIVRLQNSWKLETRKSIVSSQWRKEATVSFDLYKLNLILNGFVIFKRRKSILTKYYLVLQMKIFLVAALVYLLSEVQGSNTFFCFIFSVLRIFNSFKVASSLKGKGDQIIFILNK